MTEIANVHDARARASRIRAGIGTYLTTLADVSAAYEQRDWEALGYGSWDQYVDGEYSELRLKLSPEHRQKAVAELRLAGMSQRAIGTVLGVSAATVNSDLSGVQDRTPESKIKGSDGKTYASSQPPKAKVEPEPEPVKPKPVELPKHQGHADASLAAIDEAEAIRAEVASALDRFVPDPEAPKRRWRIAFLDALGPTSRLMAQFKPEHVADSADDECLDELARLEQRIVTYCAEVRAARPIPDNVRHLRAVS